MSPGGVEDINRADFADLVNPAGRGLLNFR
jgi:hypothetical protein